MSLMRAFTRSGCRNRSHLSTSTAKPSRRYRDARLERLEARQLLAATIYRVNAGGAAVADTFAWAADTSATPSQYLSPATKNLTSSSVASVKLTHPSIPAGTPAAIFQTERWENSSTTDMQWNFPVTAGQYEVRLFFAETYSPNFIAGARKFDVLIEGNVVLNDYDIFADVGGNTAAMKSFVVTANSNLDVDFAEVTQHPALKAIEVISLAATTSPPTTPPVTPPTAPPPSSSSIAYRVNAGGSSVPGTQATNWSADTQTTPSPYVNAVATKNVTAATTATVAINHSSIPAGTPQSLFQSERWENTSAAELQWDFPVTAGQYEVRLYFAETYAPNFFVGARKFDVLIEGSLVLNDYDIFAEVGGNKGIVKSFVVTANSNLDIDFAEVAQHPSIKAIEILSLGTTTPPVTPPVVPPTTPPTTSHSVVYRINAGGPSVPAGSSISWATDTAAAPSTFVNAAATKNLTATTTATVAVNHSSIPAGTPASLFQTERWENSFASELQWDFPVTAGTYEVRLYFAETYAPNFTVGARKFDVLIEGNLVLNDYDIFADVGGNKGVMKSFTVTANSNLDIDFAEVTQHPAIKAIEILSSQVVPTPPTTTTTALTRVNAGGDEIAGSPAWTADTKTSPSSFVNANATGNLVAGTGSAISLTHSSLPAGTPAALFQSERYDVKADPDLKWSFPVTPGQYQVNLYFSETYAGNFAVGARVFDVYIEGQLALNDYDIYAEVGANKGVMKSFTVSTDATLNVDLLSVLQNAKINAMEIIPLVAAPNTLIVTPSTFDFGFVAPGSTKTTSITLKNSGQSGAPNIAISKLTFAGSNAFSSTQSLPLTLTPGQTVSLPIKFAPTAALQAIGSVAITHSGNGGTALVSLTGSAVNSQIDFSKAKLPSVGLNNPTSLEFGPDGRLYVAQQNGQIKVLTVVKNGSNYSVTKVETIDLIKNIPNHNDNGAVNPNVNERLVTGLLVTGSTSNPVIYVGSSDPRIGAGASGDDLNLDTNSGMISRLTWNGSAWQKLDIVRGLPRSEENHMNNGMALDKATNTLYVAMGGNTNMGAPSNNFAFLPEYALSSAILSINLNAIGNGTYDLPTLDDQDRPGVNDANDPFGGNDGKNQAKLVPGGPVQVYSPGWRNPYDVVLTQSGKLYSIDNGGNGGWGDAPKINNNGTATTSDDYATNAVSEPGVSHPDGLHLIPNKGYYAGHPNPTRASTKNTFNPANPQSPVTQGNPVESYYLPSIPDAKYPGQNGSFVQFNNSTNGLTEYTASNFGGQLKGNLLAVSYDNAVKRIVLNSAGTDDLLTTDLFSSVGVLPLDVTTQGDQEIFPGTIWVADYVGDGIVVYTPNDSSGNPACPGDSDCDKFTDADEIANGTSPTNGADFPPDFDGDFVSNLTDLDDDNDSIPDKNDAFAIDPQNGASTPIGTFYSWENGTNSGGLLNLSFTGLLSNGSTDYLNQFNAGALTAGGAAGALTIDAAGTGTALNAANNQTQAFQFGFNAAAATSTFVGKTSLLAPFAGQNPKVGAEMGFYLGTGDQDNYVSLVVSGDQGGQVKFISEVGGVAQVIGTAAISFVNLDHVNLDIQINPITKQAVGVYQTSVGGVMGTPKIISSVASVPAAWLTEPMAIGVISKDSTPSTPVSVTWDYLGVVPGTFTPPSTSPGMASLVINAGENINASTYGSNTIVLKNNSASTGPTITGVVIDLTNTILPDIVFDPSGTAGDLVSLGLVPSAGVTETGYVVPSNNKTLPFSKPYQKGFLQMSLSFNNFGPGKQFVFGVDIDPTTIQGLSSSGRPQSWPGSVSGLELSGATITVTYSNGTSSTGTIFGADGQVGQANATVNGVQAAAPTISIVGLPTTPTAVGNGTQTVRVAGPAGTPVRLMIGEGTLDPATAVFDVDLYEANSFVNVRHFKSTIGGNGFVDIPVPLTSTSAIGGLYHFAAVVQEPSGRTGQSSNVLKLRVGANPSAASEPLLAFALPQNFKYDVNQDGSVSARDALLVINAMNASNFGGEPTATVGSLNRQRFDVNQDGSVTALDALLIINHLNRQSTVAPERPGYSIDNARDDEAIATDVNIDVAINELF